MRMNTPSPSITRRRKINLTIPEDLIEQAKAMNLNASEAAEAGLRRAIADAQAARWREESRAAIAAHNARAAERGVLLTPDWARED